MSALLEALVKQPEPPCIQETPCPLLGRCKRSREECAAFRRYVIAGRWRDEDIGSELWTPETWAMEVNPA